MRIHCILACSCLWLHCIAVSGKTWCDCESTSMISQRSLHNAPIFRLLLKVAVKGTHQCDFLNFWGALAPTLHSQQLFQIYDYLHLDLTVLQTVGSCSQAKQILLWMTPSEAPKALQTSECSELLDPMRASCWIFAQHQPGKFMDEGIWFMQIHSSN